VCLVAKTSDRRSTAAVEAIAEVEGSREQKRRSLVGRDWDQPCVDGVVGHGLA